VAGKKHQFIVGLIIRKIRELGYEVKCIDGKTDGAFYERYPLPPTIQRHRPDVIAVDSEGNVCIGEAKTAGDLNNNRINEQIVDFTSTDLNGKNCYVVIGVPMSCKESFEKKLKEIKAYQNDNLDVLFIPDEIIND